MGATALATMVLLIFTGCLDGKDALAGFANTNNIVIVTMFVVAAGLNRTQFHRESFRPYRKDLWRFF